MSAPRYYLAYNKQFGAIYAGAMHIVTSPIMATCRGGFVVSSSVQLTLQQVLSHLLASRGHLSSIHCLHIHTPKALLLIQGLHLSHAV